MQAKKDAKLAYNYIVFLFNIMEVKRNDSLLNNSTKIAEAILDNAQKINLEYLAQVEIDNLTLIILNCINLLIKENNEKNIDKELCYSYYNLAFKYLNKIDYKNLYLAENTEKEIPEDMINAFKHELGWLYYNIGVVNIKNKNFGEALENFNCANLYENIAAKTKIVEIYFTKESSLFDPKKGYEVAKKFTQDKFISFSKDGLENDSLCDLFLYASHAYLNESNQIKAIKMLKASYMYFNDTKKKRKYFNGSLSLNKTIKSNINYS